MPVLTNRWAVLALLIFARLAMAMQFGAVAPLVPRIVDDLGVSYAQVGWLIGLFMLPGAFLALPGGLLGQRFGDKPVVLAGLALMVAGALLLGHAGSFPAAVAGRLLSGIGAALFQVQTTKMVADWFAGKESATAMGLFIPVWPVGIALALAALSLVAELASWRVALDGVAAMTALALLAVLLLYGAPDTAEAPDGSASSAAGGARDGLWRIGARELVLVSTISAVWVLINTGFIVFVSFVPPLLVAQGYPLAAAGSLASVAAWCALVSVPLGGVLIDRTGHRDAWIAGASAIGGAIAAGFVVLGGWPLAWMLAWGLLRALGASGVMAAAGAVLSSRGRSTGFGVFFTLYYVGMAVLPPVAGWLQDRAGSAAAAVLLAAVLMLGVPPVLGIFRLLQRRWAPAPQPVPEAA